ncbi:hypothetical protein NL676_017707 [Syzygium grande]|nr:hypothetical protein NL676_017707 [Syzygium grande]
MAAAREALDVAGTALNEVIALIKAQQVLPISSVEEVKLVSRFMPRFADRGALRKVVIRGSGNTYIREDASKKIRKALFAYWFLPCEQLFDLPRMR